MQKRISWIDVCRGIGILLVIYGHGLDGNSYRYIIYSFHMPLFFFLSGIVFHVKSYESFSHFFKKVVKNIMLPYFLFAFVTFLLWMINVRNTELTLDVFLNQLYGIFYGSANNNFLIFDSVLWFLPCLFVTQMVFHFITKIAHKKSLIAIVLIIFSIIGYLISYFFPKLNLPFGIEIALTAVVFFGAGYLWNTQTEKVKLLLEKHAIVLSISFLILCVILSTMNYSHSHVQVDMRWNRLQNYFLTYLAAFSGILSCVAISMLIQKNSLLEYIGKRSLILFVWHLVVFYYITLTLLLFLTPEKIAQLRNLYLTPLYTILSITIILFFSYVYGKLKLVIAIKKDSRGSTN